MKYDNTPAMTHFFRSHPWHGVPIGEEAPALITCYVEIVPTDTIKYELDKDTGFLKVDRPQKYSNYCPALYGLVPQTYCGRHVADYCAKQVGLKGLEGDNDPLDICILVEKPIHRSDILIEAIPIGGLRTVDRQEADDKIIAVLKGDLVYGHIEDIRQCPPNLIDRLKHYFLTYKDCPGESSVQHMEIKSVYGREEAHEVIRLAQKDYKEKFSGVWNCYQEISQSGKVF